MMKKTLITLLALAGVATAGANSSLLPVCDTFTWIQKSATDMTVWDMDIGGGVNPVTADLMTKNLTACPALHETGWRWATGNLNYSGNDVDFLTEQEVFFLRSRSSYKGAFVVATRELSDFLTQPDEKLTSLTISFEASGQSDIGFSAWVWDGTKAITLIDETKSLNVGNDVVNAFTVKDLSLGADETIMFLWNERFSGTDSNGAINYITGLTSSYTAEIVPEPATSTLSLLALAGLAARRSRK